MLNFIKKRSSSTLFLGVGTLCLGIALLAGTAPFVAFCIAIGISALFTLGIASIRNQGRNASQATPVRAAYNSNANLSNAATPAPSAPQPNPHPILSATYDLLCVMAPP